MSNYKLWELTSPASRETVNKLALEVAEEIYTGQEHFTLTHDNWGEPTQALVYAMWREFWNRGKPYLAVPPYTRRAEVRGLHLLENLMGGDVAPSHSDLRSMYRSIYSVLSNNQLVMREKIRGNTHYVREWPRGFVPTYTPAGQATWLSKKDEADVRRQEARAEELAGPVTKFYSLPPVPDNPTFDQLVDYMRKWAPIVKEITKERDELRAEVDELREKIAAFDEHKMVDLTNELKDLLNG